MTDAPRYSAFISYTFADKAWAQWLHRELERFRLPKAFDAPAREGTLDGRKLLPVFRDRDELAAGADLGAAVKEALDASATLVVLCSPRSAQSRWVSEEIRHFRQLGRGDRIFCLIIDEADDGKIAFPPALTENGEAEPLAADARAGQDGKPGAKLKLLAAILGVDYDLLRRREHTRRMRQLTMIAAASTVGFLVTTALAVTAYLARNEAVEQRNIAIERTRTAERTVAFVKGMFEISDPTEALGNTITAREILDRAAEQFDNELSDEPNVEAEIGLTLSEVYAALGLYKRSDALLAQVAGIEVNERAVALRRTLLRGESRFRSAEYEDAAKRLESAVADIRLDPLARETLLPRALDSLGEAYSALDRFDDARKVLTEALALKTGEGPRGRRASAKTLEAMAANEFYAGDLDRAQGLVERAIALRRRTEGENSPIISDDLNMLGSILYMEGERAEAAKIFRSRLAIDEKVLGEEHPDVGLSLNNIGRIELEDRKYASARTQLRRAVRLIRAQRGDLHDDLAFAAGNLAIVEQALGNRDEAAQMYDLAIGAARARNHRNLAPLLVDKADLLCTRGNSADGMALLDEAEPLMRETYPDEPWRPAWVESTRGACLVAAGKGREAGPMLRSASGAIEDRWDAASHFAWLHRQRLAAAR